MPSSDDTRPAKLAFSFKTLAQTASELNSATKRLSETIAALDDSLKGLNLGISSWIQFASSTSADGLVEETHELGYAKINGKWGVAIRHISWFAPDPEQNQVKEWLFADASRELRLKAIDYVPKLIEQLNNDAQNYTAKLTHKIAEAEELTKAINGIGRENVTSFKVTSVAVKK